MIQVPKIVDELLEAGAMPFNLTPSEPVDAGHADVEMSGDLIAQCSVVKTVKPMILTHFSDIVFIPE